MLAGSGEVLEFSNGMKSLTAKQSSVTKACTPRGRLSADEARRGGATARLKCQIKAVLATKRFAAGTGRCAAW